MNIDSTTIKEVIDVDELMSHVGNDKELLAELFEMFREYYPEQLTEIQSGIQKSDSSTIREVAHQLKGAISNFHANEAVEAAKCIEHAGRDEKLEDMPTMYTRLENEISRMCSAIDSICE